MKKKGDVGLDAAQLAKVKQLAAEGFTPRRIARTIGKSPHTVAKVLRNPVVIAEVKVTKAALAEKFKLQSERVLDSICDRDIAGASLQQKSVSSGILIDKSLLLSGDPTVNLNIDVLLDVAEAIRSRAREPQESSWRESHTRLVAEGAPCTVRNCSVHSSRLNLPAGTA